MRLQWVTLRCTRGVLAGVLAITLPPLTGLAQAIHVPPSSGRSVSAAHQSRIGFASPATIAVDAHGHIYVDDRGHGRIVALSPSGAVLAVWHGVTGPLALDERGHTYAVAVGANNRSLLKLSSRGAPLATWRVGFVPAGVAVDARGRVYVSNGDNDYVVTYSPTGRRLARWGREGASQGQFEGLAALAIDRHGDVYAADIDNGRIQKLSPSGRPLAVWSAAGRVRFAAPTSIALTSTGIMYVAMTGDKRIQKLSPSGKLLAQWTITGSDPKRYSPLYVAVNARGTVYVSGGGTDAVQTYSPAGKLLAVWR